MLYGAFRFLAVRLSICVIFAGAFLHAICQVDEIVVSGSRSASIRVLRKQHLHCTRTLLLTGAFSNRPIAFPWIWLGISKNGRFQRLRFAH